MLQHLLPTLVRILKRAVLGSRLDAVAVIT
nr:MAG TPA: hypothetical protein [Caudoviricetes sp.]